MAWRGGVGGCKKCSAPSRRLADEDQRITAWVGGGGDPCWVGLWHGRPWGAVTLCGSGALPSFL